MIFTGTTLFIRTCLTTCLLFCLLSSYAQSVASGRSASAQSGKEEDLRRQVLETEKRRFAAQVAKDYATLDRIISGDLHYIHSNGDTDTKASFIGGMKEGKRSYQNIVIDTITVRIYHRNTAVLNGECTYFRTGEDGQPNNLRLRYTDVYIRRGKDWQMVSWQSFRKP
jgi:hypothetical protein